MKNNETTRPIGKGIGWLLMSLIAATALAWAVPANAGAQRTAQILDIPLSFDFGEWTSPDGNFHVRGMKAVSIHLSADPLVNGRMSWVGDVNAGSDGNGLLRATWVHEVGTWTGVDEYIADPANNPPPVFTPAADGAVIVGNLEMKCNLFTLSAQVQSCVGHGMNGQAEGMQVKVDGGTLPNGLGLYTARILDPHQKK